MSMFGADADALDLTSDQVSDESHRLVRVAATLTQQIHSSPWQGRSANRFRQEWRAHRGALADAAAFLEDAADGLREQARQQREASGSSGGHHAGSRVAVPIPGRPENPDADSGAGRWGQDPWYSTGDDRAVKELAYAGAAIGAAKGWGHAADNLNHYLDNSGDTKQIDPDTIAEDVDEFRAHLDDQARAAAEDAAQAAIAEGRYGEPIPFTSDWSGFYLESSMSQDWFYALGGVQTAATGTVIVHPGEPPRLEIQFQSHLYDRYNWDGGKSTQIGPFEVTDAQLAELHRAGVAREYDVEGSSGVRTLSSDGSGGSTLVPQPPTGRR